jgi:hypothetical protein
VLFVLFSSTLFVLHSYLFLCLGCPTFCLYLQNKHLCPRRHFLFFSFTPFYPFCALMPFVLMHFIRTCLSWVSWLFVFLVLILQQTQPEHQRPGGIRTRTPSKRSAADTYLRPLGHWDRHVRSCQWVPVLSCTVHRMRLAERASHAPRNINEV